MPNNEIAIPDDSAWGQMVKASNQVERYAAGQYAMELVPVAGLRYPVPRFMFDLPWSQDNEEVVDEILVQLAAAPDIEKATAKTELRKFDEIAGLPCTILDVRVRPSNIDDARWGAYLSCAVSVDGEPAEVINGGQGQLAVTLWRCWCEGRFPVSGVVTLLGQKKEGRHQPVGFSVESALG